MTRQIPPPHWAQPAPPVVQPAPMAPPVPLALPEVAGEELPPPDVIQKNKDGSTKELENQLKKGAEHLGNTHKEKTDYLHAVANQQKQQFNVMLDQQVKEQEMILLQEYNQQLKRLQQAAQSRKAELETQANKMAMNWQQQKVMEEFVRHKNGIEEQYEEAKAEIDSKIAELGVSSEEVARVAAKGASVSSFNAGNPPANVTTPKLVPRPAVLGPATAVIPPGIIRQPTSFAPPTPAGVLRQATSLQLAPPAAPAPAGPIVIRQPTSMHTQRQATSPLKDRRSPAVSSIPTPSSTVQLKSPKPLNPPNTLGLAIENAFAKVGKDMDNAFAKVEPQNRLAQAVGKAVSFPKAPVAVYNTPLGMTVEPSSKVFSTPLPVAPSARLPYMPPIAGSNFGSYVSRGSITPAGSYQPPACGSYVPTPVGSYIPVISGPQKTSSYVPCSPRVSLKSNPGSYVPTAPAMKSYSYQPTIRSPAKNSVGGLNAPPSPLPSARNTLR